MALPAAVDFFDGNPDWAVFAHSALFAAIPAGIVMLATESDDIRVSPRLGFLFTPTFWAR